MLFVFFHPESDEKIQNYAEYKYYKMFGIIYRSDKIEAQASQKQYNIFGFIGNEVITPEKYGHKDKDEL